MAIVTVRELIDVVIMTVAVGFIFSGFLKFRQDQSRFDWQSFKMAVIMTVPAIILHEIAHKFVAIAYGLSASFHAAYFWLAIGLGLSLLNFPFIFFVPAYVSISPGATALQTSMIAFAGPALNGLLWLTAYLVLRTKKLERRQFIIWHMTKQINKLLFFFNMLPLPLFDGFKVYQGLISTFFG